MMARAKKLFILIPMIVVTILSGVEFVRQKATEVAVYPSEDLIEIRMLSSYLPTLEGTEMDSPVFFLEGDEPGDTIFVMGGTHPNESAGILSAILVLENVRVLRGRVIVLPVANRSALSQTLPGYAYPEKFEIGGRFFMVGSRATSPLVQWPDPPIFVQKPHNQSLAFEEYRNLNRNYPGYENGSATQMLACAITNLIESESVVYAFDLHEASITYPVNRAIIVPDSSMDIALFASMLLAERGISVNVEPASPNLRGFSYIDWADIDGVHPFLIEVPTPVTDRVQGMMTPSLITKGKDDFIERVSSSGYTRTIFGPNGFPLDYRCALHLAVISEVLNVASDFDENLKLAIQLPDYDDVIGDGLACLLNAATTNSVSSNSIDTDLVNSNLPVWEGGAIMI